MEPTGHADAQTASVLLASFDLAVSPNLIAVWAHRGKVRRVGRDLDGRTLYSVGDIWREAHRRDGR